MGDRIHDWVHQNRAAVLGSLRSLVGIDTQNLAPAGNERNGQLAFAGMLSALGCDVDVYEIGSAPGLMQHPMYWPARPATGRPNVMGIRRGVGGGRSLLISSHMDTVPVGPEPWTKPPWGGEVAGGKLYGLGAYDMKAGHAASLMVVKALNDLGIQLRGDLMIESVVDEEYGGCNGTLAARLKYNADLGLLPEPTNLTVCPAHHGGLMLRVTIHGKPGWSFSPDKPVDPVHALARFVDVLNDWAVHRNAATTPPPAYQHNHSLPVLVNQLKAGEVHLPFFSDRVPGSGWLTAWIEVYPGETQAQVVGDLQRHYREAQSRDRVLAAFEPEWRPIRWLDGSQIAPDHPGVQTFAQALSAVRGRPAVVQGAPFACDGHIFNLHSPTPLVILGPTGGNPHSPDEFIHVEDFLDLVETFIRGTIAWCGGIDE